MHGVSRSQCCDKFLRLQQLPLLSCRINLERSDALTQIRVLTEEQRYHRDGCNRRGPFQYNPPRFPLYEANRDPARFLCDCGYEALAGTQRRLGATSRKSQQCQVSLQLRKFVPAVRTVLQMLLHSQAFLTL